MFERSLISFSAFSCSFQLLTFCRIDFFDLLLMAGVKFTKNFPHLFLDSRGLNVYPRKSNEMFSCSSFLSASLQYTIFVLSGCSSSLHSLILLSRNSSILFASSSVLQWMTASSAYLANGLFG